MVRTAACKEIFRAEHHIKAGMWKIGHSTSILFCAYSHSIFPDPNPSPLLSESHWNSLRALQSENMKCIIIET